MFNEQHSRAAVVGSLVFLAAGLGQVNAIAQTTVTISSGTVTGDIIVSGGVVDGVQLGPGGVQDATLDFNGGTFAPFVNVSGGLDLGDYTVRVRDGGLLSMESAVAASEIVSGVVQLDTGGRVELPVGSAPDPEPLRFAGTTVRVGGAVVEVPLFVSGSAGGQTELTVTGGRFLGGVEFVGPGEAVVRGGRFFGGLRLAGQADASFDVISAAFDGDPIDIAIGQSVAVTERVGDLVLVLGNRDALYFDLAADVSADATITLIGVAAPPTPVITFPNAIFTSIDVSAEANGTGLVTFCDGSSEQFGGGDTDTLNLVNTTAVSVSADTTGGFDLNLNGDREVCNFEVTASSMVTFDGFIRSERDTDGSRVAELAIESRIFGAPGIISADIDVLVPGETGTLVPLSAEPVTSVFIDGFFPENFLRSPTGECVFCGVQPPATVMVEPGIYTINILTFSDGGDQLTLAFPPPPPPRPYDELDLTFDESIDEQDVLEFIERAALRDPRADIVGRPMDVVIAQSNSVLLLRNDGVGILSADQSVPIGAGPRFVIAADLNGDGRDDVVTNNAGSDDVSVALAMSGGRFQTPVSYPVGDRPWQADVADINGDPFPDIVVSNRDDGSASVLTNDGSGGFTVTQTVPFVSRVRGMVFADVDGDGAPEIAAAEKGLRVAANNGDGTFQSATQVVGGFPNAFGMSSGDLDNDGRDDMVSGSSSGTVDIAFPNADGSYSTVSLSAPGSVLNSVVTDLNGDGINDIAIAESRGSGTVRVFYSNGDRTFSDQQVLDYPGAFADPGISAGDLDGNGLPEVLVHGASLVVFFNTGGGFAAPVEYPAFSSNAGAVGQFRIAPDDSGSPDIFDVIEFLRRFNESQ